MRFSLVYKKYTGVEVYIGSGIIGDPIFFFFKQKTAYDVRISDCSSDVCSSDLLVSPGLTAPVHVDRLGPADVPGLSDSGGLVHVGLHLAFVAAALGRTGPEPVVLADAVFLRALVLDAERELPLVREADGTATLYARSPDGGWVQIGRAHVRTQVTNAHH